MELAHLGVRGPRSIDHAFGRNHSYAQVGRVGRGPACPPANHGRRPFFSCKSPFQIFIHLPGEIPHSAQGTQWVAGKQGAPLYNDTAPVIPPEREKSSHIQVNLSFNLLSSGNSISLLECGTVFCKPTPKLCKKKVG